jgi:hypothetical protein
MDYLFIRTKLQAIVALQLIKNTHIKQPFTLIEVYRHAIHEDAAAVHHYYQILRKEACRSITHIQVNGIWLSTLKLIYIAWRCKLTRGNLYIAIIDYYPLAFALKFTPNFFIRTFDDGSANTQIRDTSYHSKIPLSGNGIRKNLVRFLFPKGAAYFNRSRIEKHYTIFPNKGNVVPNSKLQTLSIDWGDFLNSADKVKVGFKAKSIMLGTVYEELGSATSINKAIALRDRFYLESDFYIPHPRENLNIQDKSKVLNIISPVESLINYLMKENLIIYHFNSTAALNFYGENRLKFIDLSKLMDEY